MSAPSIIWFRQDLRLADQAAVVAAAASGPVVAVYVLDDEAPGSWRIGGAQRWWLHYSLDRLGADLSRHGVQLVLRRGNAESEIARLAHEANVRMVHALRHYEPWWKRAEEALARTIELELHDGHLLKNPDQVLTGAGQRYRVFSPFWRALKDGPPPPEPLPAPASMAGIAPLPSDALSNWRLLPTSPDWATGFDVWTPGEAGAEAALHAFLPALADYAHARNLPSVAGSSRLSPHLHHGELSPATVWHAAQASGRDAEPFLRELGWRDFTSNIIDMLPDYGDNDGRNTLNHVAWRTGREADTDFTAWTKGLTGYPIVDAGMRQMWAVGWMHNRVRMIAASFVVKHLLIDWRRGERWFWDCLVDADYGNNAFNWQWIAGTGVDSNPFGRIMAPLVQSPKFDSAQYIREWVPELADLPDDAIHDPHAAGVAPAGYPDKLVEHREGRERALAAARRA